jgi:hypothetical protein
LGSLSLRPDEQHGAASDPSGPAAASPASAEEGVLEQPADAKSTSAARASHFETRIAKEHALLVMSEW